jgi:hypothetical protein
MKIRGYHRDLSWITDSAGQRHETGISEILPAVREAVNWYKNLTTLKGTVPTCGKPKTVTLLQSGNFWLAPSTYWTVHLKMSVEELVRVSVVVSLNN